MISIVTCDNRSITVCGEEAKATLCGVSVVVQKEGEVFSVTPLTNIKTLEKVEGK